MKRREFVFRAAGVLGSIPIARTALAQPCPPVLNVEGGNSGTPFGCGSSATLPLGALTQEAETPEQIALRIPTTGPLADASTATVRFKPSSASSWREAHPLLRLAPGSPIEGFAGTIFDLLPGTSYDVEVHVTDPGVGSQVLSGAFMTRALPAASGPATVTALPTDNLRAIVNSLSPGDVLELSIGTHVLASDLVVSVSGTAANPIYIRGANVNGTIVSGVSGAEISVLGNHLVFEDFTFLGLGGDNARRVFTLGDDSAAVNHVTIRRIKSTGAGKAVQTAGGTSGTNAHHCLVYNCEFIGTNLWNTTFITTNVGWSDDGIRLVGTGNCVWNCTLEGFGDSIAFAHSVDDSSIVACFAYRNLIRNSVDDCFEFDYAVRNCAAYDNYCENIRPLMSMDPIRGGPIYCFRNVAINIATRPFKMNTSGTGYLIYNNTMLRTETAENDSQAGYGWGWSKLNAVSVNRIAYRNNILIYRSPNAFEIYRLRQVAHTANGTIDWSNNAHYPDIQIQWESDIGQGRFDSLAHAQANIRETLPLFAAAAGLGAPTKRHQSDVITTSNPFVTPITMGIDASTEVTGLVAPLLAAGSTPRNSGVAIPGVTDGYSGSAPDMGALVSGRAMPTWGAQV